MKHHDDSRLRSLIARTLPAFAAALLAPAALAQLPDLRVVSIDTSLVGGNWQALTYAGSLDVLVENAGDLDAGAAFDVLAYTDENFNDSYDAGIDTVLGADVLPDLAYGAQQVLTLALSGPARFRGDRIHVAIDTADGVLEYDESNNVRESGSGCASSAPPGSITPVVQWAWTSSATEPASLNVMMTPAVIDVSGDGVPDVVFGSTDSASGGLVEIGVLRALDGALGSELWTVTDPALAINTCFNIAAGDIDGDGWPEIVACDASGYQLICFEHDGSFKWISPVLEPQEWSSAAIADLDADGAPEIVTGRQVLDSTGLLLWTGAGGAANPQSGALSIVCDFDLDGSPDIVAGNTVYTAWGSILCQHATLLDGYNAVANFDGDPYPELVHVGGGYLSLLEQDPGSPADLITVWGPHLLNGGGGGPPTIADLDGDGLPEIAVAGASLFAVYEHDGALAWESPTLDSSSYVTGSSVFDFNGDGAAEIVYRDHQYLRIYEGGSGAVLFETAMSSCTWHEYPLVADVDADGNAEIVVTANSSCGLGPEQGVYVFSDLYDDWVPTRKIWNQYSYHITNVDEFGAIPLVEESSWLYPAAAPFNSYRQNTLSTLQPAAAPDLTASFLQLTPIAAPDTLVARIGNGGSYFVAAGVPVSFYDGDPNASGALLGIAYTSAAIAPSGYEDVALYVGYAPANAWVVADDAGWLASTVDECDEANNVYGIPVAPTTYCTPKLNSAGCLPTISFTGLPSVSLGSGFEVQCADVVNNKSGLLFFRVPGLRAATPFQCGTLCVATPLRRTAVQFSGGNPGPNDCSGSWSLDMNCFASGGCGLVAPPPELLVPGMQVNCQYWGRDSGVPPCNTQLSDALEYTILP